MQKHKLGKTDLQLTTIGLGTWAIGGAGWQWAWGAQDDADSIASIRKALDLGINWVDTAAAYGLGHSEEVLGKALQGRREQVIVATKCGLVWEPGKSEVFPRLTASSIRSECESSLRRLKTDVIDLYQIHWPRDEAHLEEGWGTIADLVKEGKVRYAGVSNHSVAQLKRLEPIHPVASVQPPYSMIERTLEEELLPFCAANTIGVVAYSPMQTGILSGRMTRARVAELPADDWRKDNNPQYREPALSANLDLVEGLRQIAARSGRSVSELAIAWVLQRPGITAAIVGARKPSQIEETTGAGDWVLSAGDLADVDVLLAERNRALA